MVSYLLCLIGDLGEDVEDLPQILEIVVVPGCSKAQKIKEIFLVVQSHAYVELLEDLREQLS